MIARDSYHCLIKKKKKAGKSKLFFVTAIAHSGKSNWSKRQFKTDERGYSKANFFLRWL
jgi:hypothetical protein